MALVGAPSYFAKHPTPHAPQDLTSHACINLRLPSYGGFYAWEFEKGGRELRVRVNGPLAFNLARLAIEAALSGDGLAFVLEQQVNDHIGEGRLIRVLRRLVSALLGLSPLLSKPPPAFTGPHVAHKHLALLKRSCSFQPHATAHKGSIMRVGERPYLLHNSRWRTTDASRID